MTPVPPDGPGGASTGTYVRVARRGRSAGAPQRMCGDWPGRLAADRRLPSRSAAGGPAATGRRSDIGPGHETTIEADSRSEDPDARHGDRAVLLRSCGSLEARTQDRPIVRRRAPDGQRRNALAFVRTELFFGTAKPDGAVTEEEFGPVLDTVVTPLFPDGLTVIKADGQFKGARRPDHQGRLVPARSCSTRSRTRRPAAGTSTPFAGNTCASTGRSRCCGSTIRSWCGFRSDRHLADD